MLDETSPMHDYLAKLGIEPSVADIYLALQAYGPQSLLQLARNAKIERTRLYRLLDTLSDIHLIEVETHYKRKVYKAAPISNLQILLTRREQEIRDLREELATVQAVYKGSSIDSPLTHIQLYRGLEGVKQMFWNQTKAQTETVGFLYENMQSKTNLAFFERWVEKCNTRGLTFRSIVGDHFLSSQRQWYERHENEKLANWKGRYLPNSIYPITHSTITYDDVVSYFNWKECEIFGIEIYNQEIAGAQRQVFDILWQQAQPIPDHGEGNLESYNLSL